MLKLKKLIAGALISASLASPLPVYAAEDAAPEAPAAAEVVTESADALDAASYLKLVQQKSSESPTQNLDMTCTVNSAIGNAVANFKLACILSSPVQPTKEGLRSKVIDAKTVEQINSESKNSSNLNPFENLGDNVLFMEGDMNLSINSPLTNNHNIKDHYYSKMDKNSYDRYKYDEKQKKWIHNQIKAEELKAGMGKFLENGAANADILSALVNPVVEEGPSTDTVRSLIVTTNLNDFWKAVSKMSPNVPAFEIDDPEAATLSIQIDVDRKTMKILRESGDFTNTMRYVAHALLNKSKTMNEMQKNMFGALINTATAQFEVKISEIGAEQYVLIPKKAIETPAVPFPKPKKDSKDKTNENAAGAPTDASDTNTEK